MAPLSRHLSWPRLVLASGSPRRRSMLRALGADVAVVVPRVDETARAGEDPAATARRLARDKALWAARRMRRGGDRIIVAADTLVVYRHHVLGKPRDRRDAARMLSLLSDRWHTVVTGVCVHDRRTGRTRTVAVATRVRFRRLPAALVKRYVASGEPMDKAGAYGIQGLGALLVDRIDGCYFNVVGLPLARLDALLSRREDGR
ncbi:MAG: Maf family protein [Candidatus Edwardsbacteria bacterium]|jgi:septum formation protein|nr:Maf family protein [Candidatus Edwardsbacteria bacterium]